MAQTDKNKKVVDLHGGHADAEKTKPYTADTLNIVHSSGKFVMGLATLQAISEGLFDFDTKIASIWPEFAAGGKENVTVKDLLEHQGGVTWVEGEHIPLAEELSDLDALAKRVAGQPHNFGGKTTKAYHAITRGWYLSELLRRTRADKKSFGGVLGEWRSKLGVEFYCGLPDSVKETKFAHVINSPANLAQFAMMAQLPPDMPMMKMLLGLAHLKDYDPTKGETFSHSPAFLKGETPSASCVTNATALATFANALTNTNKGTLNGYKIMSEEVWKKSLTPEETNKDALDPALGAVIPT